MSALSKKLLGKENRKERRERVEEGEIEKFAIARGETAARMLTAKFFRDEARVLYREKTGGEGKGNPLHVNRQIPVAEERRGHSGRASLRTMGPDSRGKGEKSVASGVEPREKVQENYWKRRRRGGTIGFREDITSISAESNVNPRKEQLSRTRGREGPSTEKRGIQNMFTNKRLLTHRLGNSGGEGNLYCRKKKEKKEL